MDLGYIYICVHVFFFIAFLHYKQTSVNVKVIILKLNKTFLLLKIKQTLTDSFHLVLPNVKTLK